MTKETFELKENFLEHLPKYLRKKLIFKKVDERNKEVPVDFNNEDNFYYMSIL